MNERQRMRRLKLRSIEDITQKKAKKKPKKTKGASVRRGSYAEKLQQAGLPVPPLVWFILVTAVSVFFGFTLSKNFGPYVGWFAAMCGDYYFLTTWLSARAELRRRKVVPHLPGFIDTLSASLSTGYNMETAVEHAAAGLPEGVLKKEFRAVLRMLKRGLNLDESLDHIVRRISGQEVVSLCVTIRLFSGMGGRVVSPFKRLGGKMRDQQAVIERAARDLVGTKQGFYVILGLAIMVPVGMLFWYPEYIEHSLKHPVIKYVMQGSMIAVILCVLVFKKITTLRV